jgi:hypothetical protein
MPGSLGLVLRNCLLQFYGVLPETFQAIEDMDLLGFIGDFARSELTNPAIAYMRIFTLFHARTIYADEHSASKKDSGRLFTFTAPGEYRRQPES